MRFLDKTVIVTGAASGIGAAATALFAGEGATVFASDIDVAGGEKLARETPGDVRFVECDVCDPAAIKALMDHAAQETGGIDTLFNNAGAGGARESIAEIEPEAWDRTMDLLLRSVAMGIRYAVPHMKGRKGASIVNVSSVAAVGPGYSPTTYAVAKAGVLHLTKCAATDLAQFGIRVNAVQPGFINTNIFTATMDIPDAAKEQAKAMIAQMSSNAQPVARGGQSDDIAQAVAFLASEQAGFMTGASMVVDGGITLGPRHSWDPEEAGAFEALMALEEQVKAAQQNA
ncbi:MAG: SDR family oxidoreductase [Qipengyuania citrea]|jgi:NAD(P)-dependent dehydrogenase (short-subunit alcohol dehydrogenase family)|uniref:SDR family NAD(P)-dependent oxidoreductase n=1 Tax=Qipengyuania TaxID=1855416 RepID=UPI000E881E34|nr:SDR family oxidoreductase [Qipengyuania citrea]RZP17251.1 MAG: SDR family oxidoreductase [Erythrobacter sp.]HBK14803.1 2,5-dichloro-2,5-cyclohexadiene-1,4-diol dehydrogenase [Erythrobacter sp.]HBM05813.1 2,5-dichloro-2,5-cyclohexadiene-1,4-diol dehydrogenase [Erythrobacter sp.]HBM72354.1 2,5-dichloro-2,5-cyclohexadiene-1,4-diol dehydrogenase [Erythrobacter sp.]|tara:strand:- start:2043 stop:2903 length:861 start_codon:yes stop_codon:yes gene_type:complete